MQAIAPIVILTDEVRVNAEKVLPLNDQGETRSYDGLCYHQSMRDCFFMYEDLQPLANLRISKATEQYVQKMEQELGQASLEAAMRGMMTSGAADATKFYIRAGAVENICRNIADVWTELIIRKNHRLTREDLTFIMQQVEGCALTQAESLASSMAGGGAVVPAKYWIEQADTKMRRVAGDIRRDLEIRFREQEAFPPPAPAPSASSAPIQLHIQNSNVANLNLGTQLGTINAALQLLSREGEDHQAVALALKQLTEAVVADQYLKENQKQDAVEALSVLANEAESGKTSITTKALISWLPQLIGLSADLVTLWDKAGPTIRAFFKF